VSYTYVGNYNFYLFLCFFLLPQTSLLRYGGCHINIPVCLYTDFDELLMSVGEHGSGVRD